MSNPVAKEAVGQKAQIAQTSDACEPASPYIDPFKPRWDAITPDLVADIYTRQHWPLRFSNLEVHCQPGDAISYWEANVILAIIEEIMSSVINHRAKNGTFIIDGYKTGSVCKCILRGNLEDGPSTNCILVFDSEQSSDYLAAESIDDALAYPDKEGSTFARNQFFVDGDYLDSGIHGFAPLHVMALNTTAGHFLVSFYADFMTTSYEDVDAVLVAIAETLAQLRPSDEGMQNAAREAVEPWMTSYVSNRYRESVQRVRQMFKERRHPVIQAWRACDEGNLAINFFD